MHKHMVRMLVEWAETGKTEIWENHKLSTGDFQTCAATFWTRTSRELNNFPPIAREHKLCHPSIHQNENSLCYLVHRFGRREQGFLDKRVWLENSISWLTKK